MLQAHISILTFDFAGCGLSEGKFVFQGYFEQFDIEDVLEHVIKTYSFVDPQKIGLWGRSMGAIASLLFASHNNSASFIIVDSAFKDFSDVLNEYMDRVKIIPNALGKYLSDKLRNRILQTCGFDFEELKPIEAIATCKTPALFHHTTNDRIVPNYHSKDLYNAYPAEKEYLETEGNHNSTRSDEYYDAVLKFIKRIFSRRRSILEGGIVLQTCLQPTRHLGEEDNVPAMDFEHEVEGEFHFAPTESDESEEQENDKEKEVEDNKEVELEKEKENDNEKEKEIEIENNKEPELENEKEQEKDTENVTPSYDAKLIEKSLNLQDKVTKERDFIFQIKHSNIGDDDDDNDEDDDSQPSNYEYADNDDHFLNLNGKEELFSPGSDGSHCAIIINSPDVSHIMSEPDLYKAKPFKGYKSNKKSTKHSSFQVYD